MRVVIKERLNAITSVISTILALSIATFVTSAILFWGVPYMDRLQTDNIWEDTEMQFNYVLNVVRDLANCESGEQRVLSISADRGYLGVDDKYDRTIIMYSYDSDYDFTVSELELYDGIDDSFTLIMNSWGSDNVREAKINWLDNGTSEIIGSPSLPNWQITTSNGEPIDERIRIDLYDDGASSEIFGRIWVFDSKSFDYSLPASTGNREMSIERSGIVAFDSDETKILRTPKVTLGDDSIAIGVIQTIAPNSFSFGDGFRATINAYSNGVFVGEISDIYNIRLQFDEGYDEEWLNYFNITGYGGDFEKEVSGDTLFFKPSGSDDGVMFTMSYSIIRFSTT